MSLSVASSTGPTTSLMRSRAMVRRAQDYNGFATYFRKRL